MLAKKLCIVMFLLASLAVSFVQLPVGYASQLSASSEKALVFLRDVVMLDVEKYEVIENGKPLVEIGMFGELPYTSGVLILYSETSGLDVLYNFVGDALTACKLYPMYGAPQYRRQLPTDVRVAAAEFLQRYEVYTGDSSIAAMRDTLQGVDATKDTVKVVGNIKLEVSSYPKSFYWKRTFNGADYHGLIIGFDDNGAFRAFNQDMSYHTIGSTDVKITREQAIDIALKRAESYSYRYEGKTVTNFRILKDKIIANLEVTQRYKPLELYPFWMVDLPLDDVYPGFVYFIRVNLWADNGEIINIRALGGGGAFPSDASPAEPSTPETPNPNKPQTEDVPALSTVIYILAAAIIIAAVAAAAVILRKRKINTKNQQPFFSMKKLFTPNRLRPQCNQHFSKLQPSSPKEHAHDKQP